MMLTWYHKVFYSIKDEWSVAQTLHLNLNIMLHSRCRFVLFGATVSVQVSNISLLVEIMDTITSNISLLVEIMDTITRWGSRDTNIIREKFNIAEETIEHFIFLLSLLSCFEFFCFKVLLSICYLATCQWNCDHNNIT